MTDEEIKQACDEAMREFYLGIPKWEDGLSLADFLEQKKYDRCDFAVYWNPLGL